jgi:TP901 family phage tail tape measure protein
MAKKITGQDLFDVASFDQATQQITALIGNITKAIEASKSASAQLSTTLGNELKKEISTLTAQSQNLSKEFTDLQNKFNNFKQGISSTNDTIKKYEKTNKELEDQLKKVKGELDKVKNSTDGVGKSSKNTSLSSGKLSQALIGVASGAALVYKGISLLKEQLELAVKSTIEFEKAMKEVQAISRATADELIQLTENANRLGATTEKTATQIATLQKELGKLGFNTTEILASTDAIVDLSTATGEDLAGSATVAAATLRAFGLEAVEMGRVVDVMAGSFVRSGLDLEKFRESMKLVAPIARATNIDIETTTAAMSKLADAGLSGSLAGTALRNLFSNMADPTSKLAKNLGFTVQNSEDLIKAFRQLKEDGVGLAEAVQMVDVRARPAFFTLLNQVDAVERLSLEYRILDGEANSIAETMRDSLANDIEIANSAFDALRRNIVEQFTPAMRGIVQTTTTLSEFLRFLVKDLADFKAGLDAVDESSKKGAFKELLKDLFEMPKIFGTISELFERMETSNSFKKMNEDIESVRLSIDRTKKSASGMWGQIHAFEELKALSSQIKEGILDESNWEKIVGFQKMLGDEFNLIFNRLEDGTFSFKEATTAVQGQLEKNLRTIKSSIEQEEVSLELDRKKLKILEEQNSIKNLEAGTAEFNERRALDQSIKLRDDFLKGLKNEQKVLASLFKEIEGSGNNVNEILDTKTKKMSDLVTLEIELRKQQELSRLESSKFEEKQSKKATTQAFFIKEQADIRKNLIKLELDAELRKIDLVEDGTEQSLIKRRIAYEKYYRALSELRNQATLDFMKAEEAVNKEADKRGEKSLKDSIKRFKDENEAKAEALRKKLALEEDFMENLAKIIQATQQQIARLSTEIFNNQQVKRENELRAIDSWEKRRIELAGDNAEAIKAIEEEAQRKRNEIKVKQAKADKTEALFQIALNTAVGITRAFGNPLLIALVSALGVAQAAVVASRPLPQFYKGTDDSPEGLAVVGDRYGRELIQDGKTGEYRLTPNKATVQYLSEGSKVFTNKETERILSSVDHNGIAVDKLNNGARVKDVPVVDYDKLGDRFEKAVTKIPVSTTNFDERGVRTFVTKGRSRTERLNNRYKY